MILVCGEILFDVFKDGESAKGLSLDARIGGSPFNVAAGLARLGQPVGFFGGLSTDWLGDALLDALIREQVDTSAVRRLDAPTTLSFVDLKPDGAAAYAFYGAEAADRSLTPAEVPPAFAPAPAAVHLGSYSAVVPPMAAALDTLLARTPSALVSYDPNVRPTVEPDLDHWRRWVAHRVSEADLVKISAEDLALLYPGRPPEEVARGWLAEIGASKGPALVVMTCGGDGACAWTARAAVRSPGQRASVLDTVGAGDSFQAALLAALAEGGRLGRSALERLDATALRRLLDFAGRAAALVVGRRGADLPRRDELPMLEETP